MHHSKAQKGLLIRFDFWLPKYFALSGPLTRRNLVGPELIGELAELRKEIGKNLANSTIMMMQ